MRRQPRQAFVQLSLSCQSGGSGDGHSATDVDYRTGGLLSNSTNRWSNKLCHSAHGHLCLTRISRHQETKRHYFAATSQAARGKSGSTTSPVTYGDDHHGHGGSVDAPVHPVRWHRRLLLCDHSVDLLAWYLCGIFCISA